MEFILRGDFAALGRVLKGIEALAKGRMPREASAPMAREAVSMFREVSQGPVVSATIQRESFTIALALPERPRLSRRKKGEAPQAPRPRRRPMTAQSFLPRNWGERLGAVAERVLVGR
jgi:hypothetical protein